MLESEEAKRCSPSYDLWSEAAWRRVRGKALAREGDLAEGEALAREAVTLLDSSDDLVHRGEALLDLAGVLSMAGDVAGAAEAAGRSKALFEAKQSVAHTEHARSLLDGLAVGGAIERAEGA